MLLLIFRRSSVEEHVHITQLKVSFHVSDVQLSQFDVRRRRALWARCKTVVRSCTVRSLRYVTLPYQLLTLQDKLHLCRSDRPAITSVSRLDTPSSLAHRSPISLFLVRLTTLSRALLANRYSGRRSVGAQSNHRRKSNERTDDLRAPSVEFTTKKECVDMTPRPGAGSS